MTAGLLKEPADSVSAAAIIVTERAAYLMQLREALPHVSYGGWWGLFGGAVEAGETPEQALKRELMEELEFQPGAVTYFTQIAWDMRRVGLGVRLRYYFLAQSSEVALRPLPVLEGAAKALMTFDELLTTPKIIPPDLFAITQFERER